MIILALKAGLRLGELLALRREDIESRPGLLRWAFGHAWFRDRGEEREGEGHPTRGRGDRGAQGRAAPTGPLVFCDAAGRMWKKNEVKLSALARLPQGRAPCRSAGTFSGTRSRLTS